MIHVVPAKTKSDGPEVANIFFKHVFQYHGMPEQFIHDRDPRFTSQLWKTLFGLCGIKLTNSTAYHPQTDGQTEVVNKSIEDYLRHFGDENQTESTHNYHLLHLHSITQFMRVLDTLLFI
jgi:hypothetical protein